MPVVGVPGAIDLLWTIPTARTNGEVFSANEIQSFRIFYGTDENSLDAQILIGDSSARSERVINLADGTYYFRIMLTDIYNIDSGLSSVYSATVGQ